MEYNSTVCFGTVNLHIQNINDVQVPGTVKSVIGRNLIKYNIPGRGTQDWEISLEGNITGTAYQRSTQRASVQGLYDFKTHTYDDGMHQGTYIMEDLSWKTSADSGGQLHSFNIKLIEYNC